MKKTVLLALILSNVSTIPAQGSILSFIKAIHKTYTDSQRDTTPYIEYAKFKEAYQAPPEVEEAARKTPKLNSITPGVYEIIINGQPWFLKSLPLDTSCIQTDNSLNKGPVINRGINRVINAARLRNLINKHGIKHLHIPKKYFIEKLHFGVCAAQGVSYSELEASPITLEEVRELALMAEKSCYWDLHKGNVKRTNDGLSIIDTGTESFDSRAHSLTPTTRIICCYDSIPWTKLYFTQEADQWLTENDTPKAIVANYQKYTDKFNEAEKLSAQLYFFIRKQLAFLHYKINILLNAYPKSLDESSEYDDPDIDFELAKRGHMIEASGSDTPYHSDFYTNVTGGWRNLFYSDEELALVEKKIANPTIFSKKPDTTFSTHKQAHKVNLYTGR